MVEFIKTCSQYPCWFWWFFQLHNPLTPLSAQEKIPPENAVQEEWGISVFLGIMIKTWGKALLGGMSKMEQIQFLTHKCICSNLNTINLKRFCNHARIYRFKRKFKTGSGEIKHLGVYRNIIIGNLQYVCLLCWCWPKGWDNFQKREDSRKWGNWFWNSRYRHFCTLVLVHKLITFFRLPLEDKI